MMEQYSTSAFAADTGTEIDTLIAATVTQSRAQSFPALCQRLAGETPGLDSYVFVLVGELGIKTSLSGEGWGGGGEGSFLNTTVPDPC